MGFDAGGAVEDGAANRTGGRGVGEEIGIADGGIGAGGESEQKDGAGGGQESVGGKFIESGDVVEGVGVGGERGLAVPDLGVAVDAVEGGDAVAGGDKFAEEQGGFGLVEPIGSAAAAVVE